MGQESEMNKLLRKLFLALFSFFFDLSQLCWTELMSVICPQSNVVSHVVGRRSSTQVDLIRSVTSIRFVRLFTDEKEVAKLRVKVCDVVFF